MVAILFVPGFMADRTLWDEVAACLDTTERLEFADLSVGSSIPEMARAVLAQTPGAFVLVGFSMGGYVAREMARLAPDRVRALILIATSARRDSPQQVQRKADAVRHLSTAGFSGLGRASIQASLHPCRAQDRELIERIRGMSARLGKAVFVRQATIQRDGDLGLLSQITCPTLVIAAAEDRLRSIDESRELVSRIPKAEFIVIPGSGHMIPMEKPDELAQLISDWLKQVFGA
ncbi:MAG: alpha/beta hydrolase [Alcaligenaceae bacterium]|nr:alpha/beta hydrolase [Alcaligenaceae bacterium]